MFEKTGRFVVKAMSVIIIATPSRKHFSPPHSLPETENRNVAARLSKVARLVPGGIAVAAPEGPPPKSGPRSYRAVTFGQLDEQSDAIARGLIDWGVRPGMRLVMLVPFGIDFIRLTFGLLKAGIVVVLVDPGMGAKNLVSCVADAKPDGFVAIPKAQAIRSVLRRRFPKAKWNVTVGRRWLWGGESLARIETRGKHASGAGDRAPIELPPRLGSDQAAIIFTTGSTGPPKGVEYTHDIFNYQIDLIRRRYGIRPGGRDVACFPLFGLFDAVMGVTTIIPDMDPTRPADVNPLRILEAVEQWQADQAFGSPALWNTVSRWCEEKHVQMPTLRRVLSAGAPVPVDVLERMRKVIHPDGEIFTPYGATEALPIASIESRVVLEETAPASREGRGTCVGSRFDSIQWRVIAIDDGPIASIEQTRELPVGEIGELMVRGPVITQRYATRDDQNALHKVRDGAAVWHRMGDVGYLDEHDRFWFCGRKSHRVQASAGTLYTIPCEAIFNRHQDVYRCALVGVGAPGSQRPVLVVEPYSRARPANAAARERLVDELRSLGKQYPHTSAIEDIRIYPKRLPVDIRHNSKIFREQLAAEVSAGGDN